MKLDTKFIIKTLIALLVAGGTIAGAYFAYQDYISKQLKPSYLSGDWECKQFTSKILQGFDFPENKLNKSNDYYADIVYLQVSKASAINPFIKITMPKEITPSFSESFPDSGKSKFMMENMNVIVKAQWDKIPQEEARWVVILYDTKYNESLKTNQRTYKYGADNGNEGSISFACWNNWDYFYNFRFG